MTGAVFRPIQDFAQQAIIAPARLLRLLLWSYPLTVAQYVHQAITVPRAPVHLCPVNLATIPQRLEAQTLQTARFALQGCFARALACPNQAATVSPVSTAQLDLSLLALTLFSVLLALGALLEAAAQWPALLRPIRTGWARVCATLAQQDTPATLQLPLSVAKTFTAPML